MACDKCPPDPGFNKNAQISEKIDSYSGKCTKCGKRHLDYVIGNMLSILKEKGQFPPDASLKDVGTPLVAFGFRVPYPPRLYNKSLVLIMDSVTKDIAKEIVSVVPELKGLIRRKGLQSRSIGIPDTDCFPHIYDLLAGCDIRCDIISSFLGELCIYKNQSKIHIEFNNTKIGKMEDLYLKGDLEKAAVVDGFCGPGTLGLLSVLAGARKVVFNDAWLPALKNTILNIKMNSGILGVKVNFEYEEYEKLVADEPVLLARADGTAEILVYHGDIRKLYKVVKDYDICIIDTFPSVNPLQFMAACRDIAEKVVII